MVQNSTLKQSHFGYWSCHGQIISNGQLADRLQAGDTSTGQVAAAALCGWEGNRRYDIALAMRHKLRDIFIYGLNGGLRKGDQHLTYAPGAIWHPSPISSPFSLSQSRSYISRES